MTHLQETQEIFKTDKMGAYLHAICDPNFNGQIPFDRFCISMERMIASKKENVIVSNKAYYRD